MSARLTAKGRVQVIERILEARFVIVPLDELRGRGATRGTPRGDAMGRRGVHSRAIQKRERERLVEASDAELCAELAELS